MTGNRATTRTKGDDCQAQAGTPPATATDARPAQGAARHGPLSPRGAGADARLLARVQLPRRSGMIYLQDNPLLREPLKTEHVKHRLLGHWGASPALSFVWVHLNRLIVKHDLDVIFVAGPGHGAPGVLGPAYLEGTYSEVYPDKSEDEEGMQKFFKQFSFPGHIGSHVHAGDARLDPRRRRARLQPVARLRHGVRQPRPDRRLRGRRRRGRDRTARDRVALEQVPQPGPRRRGAADPQPERLQDRQPDDPRAHQPRGAARRCSSATATRRTSSRAATRRRCTRRWPRRSSRRSARSARSSRRPRDSEQGRRARAGR